MNIHTERSALSSEEKVKAIATQLIFLSGKVHDALKRLSPDKTTDSLLTPYALLTEEYALRFRANILLTDAGRFVISDFDYSFEELVSSLSTAERAMNTVTNLEDLSDIITGLTLFSNSIVSKKKSIISFLLENLVSTRVN